jgi:hypothetical protein
VVNGFARRVGLWDQIQKQNGSDYQVDSFHISLLS